MKKTSFTLLLILLLCMAGTKAWADGSCGEGITWAFSDGTLTISKTGSGSGKMKDYDYENQAPWYSYNYVIKTIVINEGVTSIGSNAFEDCSGLTSITIPNSVTRIGVDAFYNCSALTSVTIPNSVTRIDDVTFYGCSGLTSITIPNSVTSIGGQAFVDCSGLTSITIPNSVTSIGTLAFCRCSGLTLIKVDAGNTKYDSRNNCNAIIETASNTLVTGCKNTVIPNGVTSIDSYAFQYCSDLTSITIPNSVTSIGTLAFRGCSGLTSITIPNSVTSIDSYAFQKCSGLTSVTIPNSVTYIGNGAFSWCSSLASIKVDTGNTEYDSRNNCNAIIETASNTLVAGCKNTVIPNSVTSIGYAAFEGYSELTSITIPKSVTSIGNYAFYGCSSLTSVTVLNPTPVTITYDTFTNRANATLYVRQGSKSAYQAAKYWKEFKEIIEIDPSGIDQIMNNENGKAIIFTLDGKRVTTPQRGLNIIRMKDGTTRKVVVK